MFRRLFVIILLVPFTWGVAGSRPSINEPPPTFATSEQELEWIDEEIERLKQRKRSSEGRAEYYESEAERLLFIDFGYARHYQRRAAREERRAVEAQQRIEELQERKARVSRGTP